MEVRLYLYLYLYGILILPCILCSRGEGGGTLNITIACNGRLYVPNRNVLCLQAAEELQNLRDHHTQEANHLMKQNSQKIYQELINKGKLA